jgi:hypothetical protein
MVKQWLYFGCYRQSGHYVFDEGMHREYRHETRRLSNFDGALPAQDDATPYVATISRLGGFNMTALAFWDYSVDKRGGSNSIIFAPGLEIDPEQLLSEAQRRFPRVFARLPQPVTLRPQPQSQATPT